jgi:transposase
VKARRVGNLELVTPTTLVVGIDGHAQSNTAAFYLATGVEAIRPKKFKNDRKGFLGLIERVDGLKRRNGLDRVIYVLEPNGPYWMLLAKFLTERGEIVKVVSALQVKRNRETEDCSPEKNDYRDARSAADLGRQGKFNDTILPSGIYEDLRGLARAREDLIEQRSMHKHRLRAEVVRAFPELLSCVSDILGKGVVALLRLAPTAAAVSSLGVEGVLEVFRRSSARRHGRKKAAEIVAAASESVGYAAASSALHVEIEALISVAEAISEQVDRLEREMERLLAETEEGSLLLSIPGIGRISAATILGETGGLKQYRNPNQIRKLAGLDLVGRQSGSHQGAKRISKRGRRLLRKVLYQVAVVAIRCNQVMVRYYKALTDAGRSNRLVRKEALVAVMGKIVEIAFSIVRTGREFDPEYRWVPPARGMVSQAAA